MSDLGNRLRYLLNNNNLTITKLVESTKISQSTISRILSSKNITTNKNTIDTLANYFDVPSTFLSKGEIECNNINCKPKIVIDTNGLDENELSRLNCPQCNKRLYRMFGIAGWHKPIAEEMYYFDRNDLIQMTNQLKFLFDEVDYVLQDLIDDYTKESNIEKLNELKSKMIEKWEVYEKIEKLGDRYNKLE